MRNGPRVGHMRFDTLDEAIDAMERQVGELAPAARRRAIQVGSRRFDAARQVAVRAEVTGPGGLRARARGGVDMRGDGSTEAYTGRLRRRLVEPKTGESVYDALRRALQGRMSD
jgi:hypothetical protein